MAEINYYRNVRTSNLSTSRASRSAAPNKKKRKLPLVVLIICAILIWGVSDLTSNVFAQVQTYQPEIAADIGGYCLDDYHAQTKPGSLVDSWPCNGTLAQNWSVVNNRLINNSHYCLGVNGSKVVMDSCKESNKKQITWYRDVVGFQNQFNHQCLSLPNGKTDLQLITISCNGLTSINESWTPNFWHGSAINQSSSPICNQSNLGLRVACFAQRQWVAWQSEPKLHSVLINYYTDNNSYEEWCADFVSYIYAEAGAPFNGGERGANGWDQYNANDIQYMGFNYHSANSGYVPQAGDVAFFNYPGGHVELVVKGGTHPTFIYGDSGTIDPETGNGDMAKNQILSVANSGSVVYYLSPN